MDLNDKTVIVTGGARGLGYAIAAKLADRGARLALIDVDAQTLEQARERLTARGAQVRAYTASVSDEAAVAETFDRIVSDFGSLDGLVNNAGIIRDGLLVKVRDGEVVRTLSLQDWHSVIEVNLTGVFLCGREAAVRMIAQGQGGVIVNVSSISRHGNRGQSNYSAAKAGVHALTVTWAKELAPHGIRTATISPGFTGTELVASMNPKALERIAAAIPAGRLADPDEIAAAAAFIFENDYVNGRDIAVDGALRI